MTSLEWQPGNRYGDHISPRYNALSYTWGRWRLEDGENPNIRAIGVNGVDWDLPRIDPSKHFNVTDFQRVIGKVIEPVPLLLFGEQESHLTERYICNVTVDIEFLWLDVACIDQRFPPWAMREIGRQIKIFHGACRTFVWLNNTCTNELQDLVSRLLMIEKETISGTTQGRSRLGDAKSPFKTWLSAAAKCIGELLDEPWFTSLWTLQEAFLCPGALLLSREGSYISGKAVNVKDPIQLSHICRACTKVQQYCDSDIGLTSPLEPETGLLQSRIHRAGLTQLAGDNPLSLYIVAQSRIVTREVDYIYGIMQIFNMQLGESAKDADAFCTPGLAELEEGFGTELLLKSPVLSQLHVHTSKPRYGKGWHVSRTSAIPTMAWEIPYFRSEILGETFGQIEVLKPLCIFTMKIVRGITWAWFEGRCCSFQHLHRAWRESGSIYELRADYELISKPVPSKLGNLKVTNGRLLADFVASCQDLTSLQVLLLGADTFLPADESSIGLLLIRQSDNGFEYWKRMGFCVWAISSTESPAGSLGGFSAGRQPIFEFPGEEWQHRSGLFG